MRSKSLSKLTSAVSSLTLEYSIISERCARVTGDNCNEACVDGYMGATCSQVACFGIAASNSSVCSGYGSCISPNNCSCVGGATGPYSKPNKVSLIRDLVKGYSYENGSYAISCKDYRNATYPYVYSNDGSGLYQINISGAIITVYCDMETDGGGWTQFAGLRSDYMGEHFHVFDDNSATNASATANFHIKTLDLLANSKEIRVATDRPSTVITNFQTPNWPSSASCQIPDLLRSDILYTRSVASYSALSSFVRPERMATCKILSGSVSFPTHMSYCKSAQNMSVGFRMGQPYAGEQAHYDVWSNWATFSFPGALEGGIMTTTYYGVTYTGDGSNYRNGALFLR